MPHQNVDSSNATAQNAAVPSPEPQDQGGEQKALVRPDPASYAAEDWRDASLAPPAAGEVSDYMDEGEDLDGAAVQSGATNANRPRTTEADRGQGPETLRAQRQQVRDGQG